MATKNSLDKKIQNAIDQVKEFDKIADSYGNLDSVSVESKLDKSGNSNITVTVKYTDMSY